MRSSTNIYKFISTTLLTNKFLSIESCWMHWFRNQTPNSPLWVCRWCFPCSPSHINEGRFIPKCSYTSTWAYAVLTPTPHCTAYKVGTYIFRDRERERESTNTYFRLIRFYGMWEHFRTQTHYLNVSHQNFYYCHTWPHLVWYRWAMSNEHNDMENVLYICIDMS